MIRVCASNWHMENVVTMVNCVPGLRLSEYDVTCSGNVDRCFRMVEEVMCCDAEVFVHWVDFFSAPRPKPCLCLLFPLIISL